MGHTNLHNETLKSIGNKGNLSEGSQRGRVQRAILGAEDADAFHNKRKYNPKTMEYHKKRPQPNKVL